MHFDKPTGEIHSMPTGFGRAGGPRQAPHDGDFTPGPTRYVRHTVSFLTEAARLRQLLPRGLSLRADPVISFHFQQFTEVPWLAGRGYNLLFATFPVTFRSHVETVEGQYLAVMWEGLAEPVITGREQCGHPKLHADLPAPRVRGDEVRASASWQGFRFAELEAHCATPIPTDALLAMQAANGAGVIQHKYIPRTGAWDESDADYLTIGPLPGRSNMEDPQPPPEAHAGEGRIRLHRPRWEDMPTQHHIVTYLADLPQLEARPAIRLRGSAYSDGLDQRILAEAADGAAPKA